MLARQSNDGVRVRLEVEPPRGVALVPAVHRERDEVGAVFEVADDDAALLPGLPPDGREAQRTPAAPVRRGPQESAATESVEGAMRAPGRVHEPPRRDVRRSGRRIAHRVTSPHGRLFHGTPHPNGTGGRGRGRAVDSAQISGWMPGQQARGHLRNGAHPGAVERSLSWLCRWRRLQLRWHRDSGPMVRVCAAGPGGRLFQPALTGQRE
jgi:hypothetical protein